MSDELIPVELNRVAEARIGIDFALLEDAAGRQLPIWIDRCQAVAMYIKLQGVTSPRPMTHDLLCNSVERLGGRITRVLIDDMWQETFYGKVCVAREGEDGETQVDCRPSDALAIALRVGVPILVRDDVMEEGQVPQPLPPDPGAEDHDDQT